MGLELLDSLKTVCKVAEAFPDRLDIKTLWVLRVEEVGAGEDLVERLRQLVLVQAFGVSEI